MIILVWCFVPIINGGDDLSGIWLQHDNTTMAPSNVKMPLYVKRQLNVKKISTLNVKIDVICEKLTLNVKKTRQ